MGMVLMAWAMGLSVPATDKMVLMMIADAAGHDGFSSVRMDSLAVACSMSRKTVDRAISRLMRSRLLERHAEEGRGRYLFRVVQERAAV